MSVPTDDGQPRNFLLVGGENGGLNGASGNRPIVPIDFALRVLGSKIEAYRKAAGGSLDFWERYLRQQMGISLNAAERFLAIPRVADASLIVGAGLGRILAPNSYPRLQTALQYVATARAAYQATQLLSSTAVGSYVTAMAAAAALRARCPTNPHVAKAIEYLNQNPHAKKLLYTWYAATCASLIYNGNNALLKSMNVPQSRPALQTGDDAAPGRNPAAGERTHEALAARFNNADLAKAVNALPTSRMSQGQLHDVARLAIARGKQNRATEAALWNELQGLSTQYRAKTAAALGAALEEFRVANAAFIAAGAVAGPLKVASNLAEMKLKKLQIEVMNREMQNLPASLQASTKPQRDRIDGAAFQSAINLEILTALKTGVDTFIAVLPGLVDKYGQTYVSSAVRLIMNILREPIAPGGAPTWSEAQVNQFINSVETGRGFNRFQAGGTSPIDPAMITRLATKTYQLSVAAHGVATAQRAVVEANLPAGTTLCGDLALKALEKQEAVKKAEKASDLKLSADAVADIQTIGDITRTANQSYDTILYPDLTVMYNPKNADELWLSQVRREGVAHHTTVAEFQTKLASRETAKGTDTSGNQMVYFRIDPNAMLNLVLNHDVKNLDFEECFYVTGLDSGSPAIKYDKPTGDQQRLDHRLTAELFRVVGIHHMSSILKALASGNLHDKSAAEIEKIRKQLKFLDWINKNHFVTALPNGTPSFMTEDRNYMNHAEAFAMIREELVFQLSHRTATIKATEVVKAKKGTAAAIAEPQPEVAWAKKRALSETMGTLRDAFPTVSNHGNDLRCNAFAGACKELLQKAKELKIALDRQANTHSALRSVLVSAQEGHRPLLESFYRKAYMLEHMLENNHVHGKILSTFSGDNKAAQATQFLTAIKAAVTSVNSIYADYLNKVEYGAPSVRAAETHQLKDTLEEMAKIFANADFFLNAFERKAPTVIQQFKMGLARLLR